MSRKFQAVVGSFLIMVAGLAFAADGGSKASTARGESQALAKLIDERVDSKLAAAKVAAAAAADDAEFLRRAYLDLHGVIPAAEKASAFLDDRNPEKRRKLVDDLLADPRYGRHMAEIWVKLLMVRDSTNRRLSDQPFIDWFTKKFNDNTPWDATVRELLTATGTQEENGASTFFIALRTPEKLNDQVSRLFMGVQLQCAQCHDHPFNGWKRDDYWSMAAFFSKVRAGGKKVGVPKLGVESVNESGVGKKAPLPDSALSRTPKFLGGGKPVVKAGEAYRPVLAKWLAAPENPFFSRAMVNRTWAHFFGRGLVNPVDNVSDTNAVSHPELFDELTARFAEGGFDLKELVRAICNSRAYQRASDPAEATSGENSLYARSIIRPMSAEQLYDSLMAVLGTMEEPRMARRKAAIAKKKAAAPNSPRSKFVEFFQAPDGTDPTEYPEGIPQILRLMNSPQMNKGSALLNQVVRSSKTPAEKIERLYLATLSRRPSPDEVRRLTGYVDQAREEPREAYEDILWVLLNSSEFSLNH